MPKERANIFDDEDDQGLDVSAFSPKKSADRKAPAAEQVRAVTKAAKFQSRQAPVLEPEVKAKRTPRRYKTGRNIPLCVKADKNTVDAFNTVTVQQGWVLGYTLQRAMEALQRELEKPV